MISSEKYLDMRWYISLLSFCWIFYTLIRPLKGEKVEIPGAEDLMRKHGVKDIKLVYNPKDCTHVSGMYLPFLNTPRTITFNMPNPLAFVVSHELAHFRKNHMLKSAVISFSLATAVVHLCNDMVSRIIFPFFVVAICYKLSRINEKEADLLACRHIEASDIAEAIRWLSHEMLSNRELYAHRPRYIRAIYKLLRIDPGENISDFSHPPLAERITYLKREYYRRLPPYHISVRVNNGRPRELDLATSESIRRMLRGSRRENDLIGLKHIEINKLAVIIDDDKVIFLRQFTELSKDESMPGDTTKEGVFAKRLLDERFYVQEFDVIHGIVEKIRSQDGKLTAR